MVRLIRVFITFLIGCTLFVGIPLLAWGPADVSGFAADPARRGYVALVLILNAVAAYRIPEVGKAAMLPTTTVRRQHLAVVLLGALCVGIVMVAPYCDRRRLALIGGPTVRYVGLAMYLAGFLAMHVAEAHLGRLFSVEVSLQPGHALVTDGPYRFIRHPRYLGILVFSAGIALAFRSALGLALAAATLLVLLWRIRDEEALMRREFGPAWEVYRRRSWRLVPLIF